MCLNLKQSAPLGTYLRVSFEVNLLKRLVEPRLRVWDNGVASWDRLGEAGGPLYVAVCRSRGWPWKVLWLAVPRGKRIRSGVAALLILCVEATGVLWSGTVLWDQKITYIYISIYIKSQLHGKHSTQKFTITIHLLYTGNKVSYNKSRSKGYFTGFKNER